MKMAKMTKMTWMKMAKMTRMTWNPITPDATCRRFLCNCFLTNHSVADTMHNAQCYIINAMQHAAPSMIVSTTQCKVMKCIEIQCEYLSATKWYKQHITQFVLQNCTAVHWTGQSSFLLHQPILYCINQWHPARTASSNMFNAVPFEWNYLTIKIQLLSRYIKHSLKPAYSIR